MINDGFWDYISDNMNKMDLGMLAGFVVYFFFRLGYSYDGSNVIVPSVADMRDSKAMTVDWFAL